MTNIEQQAPQPEVVVPQQEPQSEVPEAPEADVSVTARPFGSNAFRRAILATLGVLLVLLLSAAVASISGVVFSVFAAAFITLGRIMQNIGRYLSGMVILAFMNATFSLIILTIAGVEFALVISVGAFFITLIPLIGTVLTTIFMTVFALFTSPQAALIVLISMLIYMQVEAYIFTPRVMSKAVQVPGSLVLISALAGGTLGGLPGALIAIPLAAGILIIIREVVVPAKARS